MRMYALGSNIIAVISPASLKGGTVIQVAARPSDSVSDPISLDNFVEYWGALAQ